MTATQDPTKPVDNGVNVDALLGARDVLTNAREAAAFTFTATNQWINGTHSRSSVKEFFGLGAQQSHRAEYSVDIDHPEVFASPDNGATPAELVLMALAGCLTAGVASVAQNRGLQLRSVKAIVQGQMDLAGILGIDPDVRNGYSNITVRYEIDADASREELQAVLAQSQKRSAVFDVITNPTAVSVELA
ncbi:OsmC family protein [Nocardioides sp. GY 10113]|uniref:OsmC family protein n=1 Tax=Nocardioides sp. GY 10113 TaxID=2569761 RepID=UPI0010A7C840|nr:OsmC family protein [Nocardioides sp. GY 10113]TIC88895.1 OsmC family protein [Nocardioides sp. GY 10113]